MEVDGGRLPGQHAAVPHSQALAVLAEVGASQELDKADRRQLVRIPPSSAACNYLVTAADFNVVSARQSYRFKPPQAGQYPLIVTINSCLGRDSAAQRCLQCAAMSPFLLGRLCLHKPHN